MATVVVANRVGRLANRVLLFAHLAAAASEHDFTVLNPAISPYGRHFPSIARQAVPRFPPGPAVPAVPLARGGAYRTTFGLANLIHDRDISNRAVGIIRLSRDQTLDLNSPRFLEALASHRVLFLQDWFFRNASNCVRHGDTLRRFFTPHRRHRNRALASVAGARERGATLIGIHVRRGDYRRFKNGRYFYSWQDYRDLMDRLQEQASGSGATFLVSCAERVPRDAFRGLDVIRPPGHAVQDMLALALCDRIAGPPSTYSAWASFYGRVPRHVVGDLERSLDGELDFEVNEGLT